MATRTFDGMAKAIERTVAYLDAGRIEDDREYKRMDKKTSELIARCEALWSNPADAAEAKRLKNRLLQAWHKATT